MGFGLTEIKQGMKLKCLNCGNPILVSDETLKMDSRAEYIGCPNCKIAYDVHAYHRYGEEVKQ